MVEQFVVLAHTEDDGSDKAEWTIGSRKYASHWAGIYAREYKHVFVRPIGPVNMEMSGD